jgi:hypothetical protein
MACAAILGVESVEYGPGGGVDAEAEDAEGGDASDAGSADAPSTDAGPADSVCTDPPGDLLTDPGFEHGCAAWNVGSGMGQSSLASFCGVQACSGCTGGPYFVINQALTVTVLAGEQYLFSAWVRGMPDASPEASTSAYAYLSESAIVRGSSIIVGPEWTQASVLLAARDAGTIYQAGIFVFAPCAVIDQASLVRVRDAGQE